jgi:hypothetical protein
MQEILKFIIGALALLLAFLIGDHLARLTREELKQGRPWFNLIIVASLLGAFISALLGNDALLFTFLFIAIVTSRSLRRR